eukprot:gene16548-biopygen4662
MSRGGYSQPNRAGIEAAADPAHYPDTSHYPDQ